MLCRKFADSPKSPATVRIDRRIGGTQAQMPTVEKKYPQRTKKRHTRQILSQRNEICASEAQAVLQSSPKTAMKANIPQIMPTANASAETYMHLPKKSAKQSLPNS